MSEAFTVGTKVGWFDGTPDSNSLGESDGVILGIDVGTWLGILDGSLVGETEGVADDVMVGKIVGRELGKKLFDGAYVGLEKKHCVQQSHSISGSGGAQSAHKFSNEPARSKQTESGMIPPMLLF